MSILLVPACKKEKKEAENTLSFTLDKNQYYHYQTIVAETQKEIHAFDNKIFIDGVEHPAILVDNKYIAAIATPDIPEGTVNLTFTVDNIKQTFDVKINSLPDVDNPDNTVTDYVNKINLIYTETIRAMDSINTRMGKKPDEFYLSLKEDVKKLDDSIAFALNKFNQLDADDKMVAAKFIEANRMDLLENLQVIQDINELIVKNKLSGRRNLICESDLLNTSEKLECVLENIRKNIRIMLLRNIANTARAAAAGVLVGALVPVAGWAAGAATGVLLLGYLNTKSIFYYLGVLHMNHESTYEIINNEVSTWRMAPALFYNDEDFAIKIDIQRRNFNEKDINSKYAFISGYLSEGNKFIEFVKKHFRDKITKTPTFKPEIKTSHKLEDLKYISISIKNNANVKLVGITGTADKPLVKFTSTSIEDQNFTYTVNYDDGVFQNQEEYSAVLKTRIGTTLNDTIIGGKSSVIKFKVFCPENMNWTISNSNSWIIVLPNSGKGKNESCDLAVQDNFTGSARIGYVTFTAGNYSKTISINQSNQLKIIYRSVERTLQSTYSGIMMSFDSDTANLNYTPGPGEASLNFKLIAKSESFLQKGGTSQGDTAATGQTELFIMSNNNEKIFPYQDIDNLSHRKNCIGVYIGYKNYKHTYFTGTNETIDAGLFKLTDSTISSSYYISEIYHKMMNKILSMPWCDMAPYPTPQTLPMGTSNIYLPFRIKKNTAYHYGWIRISTINNYAFKIHDYAIHSEPNAPIKTGEK